MTRLIKLTRVHYVEDGSTTEYSFDPNGNRLSLRTTLGEAPQVEFASAASETAEDNPTTITIPVRLSKITFQPVMVHYAAGGTAAGGGVDYTLLGNGTLRFETGQTTAALELRITDDMLNENDETIILTLSTPENASLGAQTTHTLTIHDAGDPLPTVRVDNPIQNVEESGGLATVNVVLSAPSGRTVTVDYATHDGSAMHTEDYQTTFGTLRFSPGQTQLPIPLNILSDGIHELNDQFSLQLSSPVNAILGTAVQTINIYDGVTPPPVVGFMSESYIMHENDAWTIVRIRLWGNPSSVPVSVDYATSGGTALANADYITTAGLSTFPSNILTTQTLVVRPINDLTPENVKTFVVVLSNPQPAGMLTLGQTTATVTLIDNDTTPTLNPEPPYTAGTTNILSWSSLADATNYRLEWSTGNIFTPVVTSNGTTSATTYTAQPLTDGQLYFYRVKGGDAHGHESPWSTTVFSTQDATSPRLMPDALGTETSTTLIVNLDFNEYMAGDGNPPAGIFVKSNYVIKNNDNGNILSNPVGSVLRGPGNQIRLILTGKPPEGVYLIEVNGIADLAGNLIDPLHRTAMFTWAKSRVQSNWVLYQ